MLYNNILEDIEWLEAFYMLLHATTPLGYTPERKCGEGVHYTKHSAIKKYTQNLIKTPKHIQNIRKKKQIIFSFC